MSVLKSGNQSLILSLIRSLVNVDALYLAYIAISFTGKYESNLIAQQLVVHYADHTIEGLELLSEVRSDEGEDASLKLDAAEEKAQAVLLRLEEAMRPDSGLALVHRPEKKATMTTISTIPCPWEDSSGYSQTTG